MNNVSPALVDAPVDAAARCATCNHPLAAHDVIGLRWCAATKLGVGNRECICSGVVAAARVLTHY